MRMWRISRGRGGAAVFVASAALLLAVVSCDDPKGVESEFDTALSIGDQPDLSGSWRLNAEASDLPKARRGGDTVERRRARRRRGHSDVGPPGDSEGSGRDGRRPRRRLRREFEISQTESTITFSGPGGRSITYHTDGRTLTRDLRSDRGQIEIQAFWSGDELVIQRTMPSGGTLSERYSLSTDGQQLFVVLRVEGGRLQEPREFRRVYDAVEPSA